MRRQRKAKIAAQRAAELVQAATEKVVGERLIGRAEAVQNVKDEAAARARNPRPAPSPPQNDMELALRVKELRDTQNMPWWRIGQELRLAGPATTASDPIAKAGAGRARSLYAAANRGEVPRTNKPRTGAVVKPTGPGRGGTVTMRKQMLVDQGHVIPRDMSDEEVQALVTGRTIEWAIDMARITNTDPATWGPEDGRWCKQDARVHVDPRWVYVYVDEDTGERIVRFREYAGRDDRGNHMSGPTRTVRVDAIYTIR